MNWDKFWGVVAAVAGLATLALLGAMIVSDKSVRSYYLSTMDRGGAGTCIRAQVEWDEDHVVFCSQDINQVLDVLVKANASLGKR